MNLSSVAAALAVSHQCWLYAHTVRFLGTAGLLVYISPLVRETDPMYRPVADILAGARHELHIEYLVKDVSMMFGQATVRLYRFLDELDQPIAVPPGHEVFKDRGLAEMGLLPLSYEGSR